MAQKFIYLIESTQGHVKIGVSCDPLKREAQINGQSALPCRLVAMWEGSVADEAALHERFASSLSHKEWFFPTQDIRSFVKENLGSGNVEVLDFDEMERRAALALLDSRKQAAIKRKQYFAWRRANKPIRMTSTNPEQVTP